VMQLTAYFHLVSKRFGSVQKGLITYSASQHEISYTNETQQRLVATLSRMRLLHGAAVVHRSHNSAGKCGHCVAKEVCSEVLLR
jgi:CRISPR/Cas system-associated exonuclease Cas4 (RecB family)